MQACWFVEIIATVIAYLNGLCWFVETIATVNAYLNELLQRCLSAWQRLPGFKVSALDPKCFYQPAARPQALVVFCSFHFHIKFTKVPLIPHYTDKE